jgi:hypothetical protein
VKRERRYYVRLEELPDDEIGATPETGAEETRQRHVVEAIHSVWDCFVDVFNTGGVGVRFRVNRRDGRSLTFTDPREQWAGTAGTRGVWGTLPEQPAGKARSLTPTAFREEVSRLIGAERAEQIVRELMG